MPQADGLGLSLLIVSDNRAAGMVIVGVGLVLSQDWQLS